MKELSEQHKIVQETISTIDDLGFWFLNNPEYITDEIGIMIENAISRLQALESAVMIKIRQLAENKIVSAIAKKQQARGRIDAARKEIQDTVTRKPKAVARSRSRPSGSGRGKTVKAKR
jgi:hypothetical protein